MLSKSVRNVVERLSEEYGFSVEEACMRLEEVCVIPFIKKVEGLCDGLKKNHGLYTQCRKKEEKNGMCKECNKQGGKYGLASERMSEGEKWRDPKGNAPIHFGNIMSKLNVSKKSVILEMVRFYNIKESDIPDELFEKKVAKRGRPKKVKVEVEDTDDESERIKNEESENKRRGRGRPKKINKELVTETNGSDLIETLIAQAKANTNDREETITDKKKQAAEKKAAKETEKEEKKRQKEEKKRQKEEEKQAKKTNKEETPVTSKNDYENISENEMEVELITIDGVEYMIDEDNIVYDTNTQEPIGKYDGTKIELCEFEYED